MASKWYNNGLLQAAQLGLDNISLKAMLVDAGYTFDDSHTLVDNGANNATDPSFNEIVATNYTGGFNGAGRKAVTKTPSVQQANDRVIVVLSDLTWTALGGAVNDTVAGLLLIREITNDAASLLIAYIDFTDTPTNGGDFTVDFDAVDGNLRIANA
jgi:hypothetical protein